MANLLHNIRLSELSLVKRGANKGARVVLVKHDDSGLVDYPNSVTKRDFTQAERDAAASNHDAMADGSFPIKNTSDLANAIRLAGNAKNPDAARAHIKARAKALGASDKIPETWSKSAVDEIEKLIAHDTDQMVAIAPEAFGKHATDIEKAQTALRTSLISIEADVSKSTDDKSQLITKSLDQYKEHLSRMVAGEVDADTRTQLAKGVTMSEDIKKQLEELTKKLTDATTALTKSQDELKLAKMSDVQKDYYAKADMTDEEKKKFADMKDEEKTEKMAKSPLKKAVDDPIAKAAIEKADALQKQVNELVAKDVAVQFEKRAVAINMPAAFGETMRKAFAGGDADSIKKMEEMIKGLSAQEKTAELFKEYGQADVGKGGATAYEQLQAKAGELIKSVAKDANGKSLTKEQAFDRVYNDPANAELRKQYKAESDPRRARAA